MHDFATFLSAPALLVWLILPVLLLLLGAFSGWTQNTRKQGHCWRIAGRLLEGSMAATLALGLLLLVDGTMVETGLPELGRYLGLFPDGLAVWMAMMVAFIGWVILRYAETYLQGDPVKERFLPWFLTTLASVLLLVFTDNLLVLAGAWIGVSLALHHLLTLYGDRREARLAAVQKFMISRVGDVCVVAAVLLLHQHYGTFHLPVMLEISQSSAQGSTALSVASLLFALAAILKCAQVPFHGWLLRVMEAPTPVSALLHAGVINLGGFLWLRLFPVFDGFTLGHLVLVVVGGVTAVVAVLTMMSQSSVKHALAWSTSAQMGFMLFEIGMGAYLLAFLHLLAHSLYKAHSFLASGRTVSAANVSDFREAGTGMRLVWAACVGAVATLVLWLVPGLVAGNSVLGGILVLAISGAFLGVTEGADLRIKLLMAAMALGLLPIYGFLHWLLGPVLPDSGHVEIPTSVMLIGALIAVSLVILSLMIAFPSRRRSSQLLRLHVSHGFYLMLPFDRLTSRIVNSREGLPGRLSRMAGGNVAMGEKQ